MAKSGEKKSRVVLVPSPIQGHIAPVLQLGNMLHSKGFSITIAHTKFNYPNPSDQPLFNFIKLPDNLSSFDMTSMDNILNVVSAINNNCKEPLYNYLTDMIENSKQDDQVACVIYDNMMYFAGSVAKHMKIPSLVFRGANAAYLRALQVCLQLLAEKRGPFSESQQLEIVPDLDPLRFKDLPIRLDSELPETVVQFQTKLIELGSSSAIICNTAEELEDSIISELQKHYQVPVFSPGPFLKMSPPSPTSLTEEDSNIIAWLDKQPPKSVVYINLGSLAILDSEDLVEIASGLANSKQPFLWMVRLGSIRGLEWIEALPEDFEEKIGQRGKIVKLAPQKEVLAHFAVGAFWSLCGWYTTLEGITEGVPMICSPCYADQRVNARYLTQVWKVGMLLENPFDREKIEKSIRKLVVEDEGKETRQNALTMKQKLDACVQKGGSSCKSLDNLADLICSFAAQ